MNNSIKINSREFILELKRRSASCPGGLKTTSTTAVIKTKVGQLKDGRDKFKQLWSLPAPAITSPGIVLELWMKDVGRTLKSLKDGYGVVDEITAKEELSRRNHEQKITKEAGGKLDRDTFQEMILKNFPLFQ